MDTEKSTEASTQAKTAHIKHAHKLIYTYLILLIIIASLGGMYTWQHSKVKTLDARVASLQAQLSKSSTTTKEIVKLQPPTTSPLIETDTLDNGTTISYPLTPENANVIWSSQDYYNPAQSNIAPDGVMQLTDKRIIQFLSLIPFDTLNTICGDIGSFSDNTAIQMYVYNPITGAAGHNQYENCIASVANSNTKYAAQAKNVLSESSADFASFESSLTVKTKK